MSQSAVMATTAVRLGERGFALGEVGDPELEAGVIELGGGAGVDVRLNGRDDGAVGQRQVDVPAVTVGPHLGDGLIGDGLDDLAVLGEAGALAHGVLPFVGMLGLD